MQCLISAFVIGRFYAWFVVLMIVMRIVGVLFPVLCRINFSFRLENLYTGYQYCRAVPSQLGHEMIKMYLL